MDLQHIKKDVIIEDKLQKCRYSVKFIWGDKYFEKIQKWIDIIPIVMERKKSTDVLITAQYMIEEIKSSGRDSAFIIMVILTAAVEILEPTKK
jgi:hypothetical protein